MSRAYLCVSIDTECDQAPRGETRALASCGAVHVGIMERLHPLFASFEAKPTYLLSPAVVEDARSTEALRTILGSCEIGGLFDRPEVHGTRWEDEEAIASRTARELADGRARLRALTDGLIRAFEHQPVSFRSQKIDRSTIPLLEEVGYAVESSVTPNVVPRSETDLGFDEAPTQPYHPDRDDPTRPGDSKILEVPMTIRRRFWSIVPGIGRASAPRWLRPTWTDGETLVRLAEDEIADARRAAPGRPVVLHATLRGADVASGASPYAVLEARVVLERLRELLSFARRESISVIGLGDVPDVLAT